MAVTMTERAAKHVAGFIEKRGKGVGLRLGVRTTGCSGMAYKLEYADAVAPEDHVFEGHGVSELMQKHLHGHLVRRVRHVRRGFANSFDVESDQRSIPALEQHW